MGKVRVSVVTSVYNDARYLRQSLDSVLSQEGVDFELIIVNDGATDESPSILAEYAGRDARVRLIEQENAGLTSALIRACSQARGEFIARHDADDLSLPGRLSALADLLESERRAVFVSSWGQNIGPEGEIVTEIRRPPEPETATRELLDTRTGPPAHGSVMFRREAYEKVGGYREQFYFGQDADLWLRLVEHGLIGYVPRFLYAARLRADSVTSLRGDVQKQFGDIGQACAAARREGRSEAELLAAAGRLRERIVSRAEAVPGGAGAAAMHYLIGSGLRRRGDARAAGYFWRAVKANPLHLRAWARLAPALAKNAARGLRLLR